jgi:hypothetical protein
MGHLFGRRLDQDEGFRVTELLLDLRAQCCLLLG